MGGCSCLIANCRHDAFMVVFYMVNDSSTGGPLLPTSPLPADDSELDNAIHDFVAGLTGIDNTLVFPRWQAQPPTMPPMSINWVAVGVVSYPDISAWNEWVHYDDYSVQRQQLMMEVAVTFYGPLSASFAGLFRDGLTVTQNWEVFAPLGIKLNSVGAITHVPELINTSYVPRSDVGFKLVREIDRTYAIKNVLSATVTIVNDIGASSVVAEVNPP